jgi:hypothetical protein
MKRTRSTAGSAADSVVDRLITAEHNDLADILVMVRTLEQLRRRGLTPDQMARHMDIEWVECPGGGEWSAATVTTILEVVDTFHLDGSRPVNQGPPSPPSGTIDSPAVSRAKQVTPTSMAPTSVTETPRTKHRRLRRERLGLRVRR